MRSLGTEHTSDLEELENFVAWGNELMGFRPKTVNGLIRGIVEGEFGPVNITPEAEAWAEPVPLDTTD